MLRLFPLLGVAASATAILLIARDHSHFRHDDFTHFFLLKHRPLLEVLLTPIDVHFVPLHRVMTCAIYRLAPLNFAVALGVLAVFHLLGVFYLYRTLQLFRSSAINPWLALLYATNVYAGIPFLWWSSGILRLPYVLCAIGSIYNYLHYRRTHSAVRLLLIVACFLAGLGFYTKAVLIPAYLLGIEICLMQQAGRDQALRNLAVVACLSLVSMLYLWAPQALDASQGAELNLDIGFQLAFQRASWAKLIPGTLGVVAADLSGPLSASIAIAWSLFVIYSVARVPRNGVVWLVCALLVALNVLLVGLSPRSLDFGIIVAQGDRYFFELMFLVIIFLAIALHNLALDRTSDSRDEGLRAFLAVAGMGLVVSCAIVSFVEFSALVESPRFRSYREGRRYVENLTRDLERIRGETSGSLDFREGRVPVYVLGFGVYKIGRHSQFLPLFDANLSFHEEGRDLYQVAGNGRIVRPAGAGRSSE